MFSMILSVPFFVAFAICFAIERRRLLNGVLLLAALMFFGLGLLVELAGLPGADLPVTLVILGFVALLFVALPLFLVGNGLLMVRREGRRLGNLLSLLAGLAIIAFTLALLMVGKGVIPRWAELLIVAATMVFGYLGLGFTAYLTASIVYGRVPNRSTVDFIVVHGSRLIRAAVPPLLASRLDRARVAFDAMTEAGGRPVIITSGGQGADEEVPEARAMADYLIDAGVPADQVLVEDRSVTTRENLVRSKDIMTERKPDYRCIMVTNNFHAFRTALLSRKLKVNGQVVGSRTAWYYLPSATIREFIGILRDHWVLNSVIVALLLAAYLLTSG